MILKVLIYFLYKIKVNKINCLFLFCNKAYFKYL